MNPQWLEQEKLLKKKVLRLAKINRALTAIFFVSIALILLEKVTRSFPLWIALIVIVSIPFLLIAMLWASVSHRRAKERLYVLQLAIEKQLFEEEANDEMFPKTLLNSTDSKSKE